MLAVCFVLIFIGCKDDENSNPPHNTFIHGENSYILPKGFIEDFGENSGEGSRSYDINLLSEGFEVNQYDQYAELAGTGEILYLDLNSNSIVEFVPGHFQWVNEDRPPNSIVGGYLGINCQADNKRCRSFYSIVAGTIDVTFKSKVYTIIVHLLLENGVSVSGTYKGMLTKVN